MEDKLNPSPKLIIAKYIFKYEIEKVWDLLIDYPYIIKSAFGNKLVSYKITKGDNLDNIGSEATVYCNDFSFDVKCIDLLIQPHYKTIKYKISSNNTSLFFSHALRQTLYSTTIDATTVIMIECEFPENEELTYSKLEAYRQRRIASLKKWSEDLDKKAIEYKQYESILIEASRKEIWDVVTNWNVLRTISSCVADEVEYDGDHLKEGSQLKLKYKTKRNVECNFEILKVANDLGNQDWQYYMGLFSSFPKIPYQEIRFSIVCLDSNKSFLTFEHIYKEKLNYMMLRNISAEKISVLGDIKNYLEK